MKTSTIDQRPTPSMIRYITSDRAAGAVEPRCTEISRNIEADQLEHGHGDAGEEHQQRDRPHAARCSSSITPETMVSGVPLPNEVTVMTGSRLAGM